MSDARQQRIDTLKAAAQRKSADKISAAESAIRHLIKRGEAVTFQAVQREAAVSHAFLYNNQQLRARIEFQRRQHRPEPSAIPGDQDSDNNIVVALSAQIARLKSQHRAETTALREALAKAHGENLDLRRELHRLGVTTPGIELSGSS